MQTLYEWLRENIGSHEIYDSEALKDECEKKTGFRIDWPEYTEKETQRAMDARGLGGTLKPADGKKLCYGYDIVQHIARIYCDGFYSSKFGRGSAMRECLQEIKRVDPRIETA